MRVTHWLTTAGVASLLVSGMAILLAHPRLYWGETGVLGDPALIDLPLPMILTGQTGWGRSLHFLSAWAVVITGTIYIAAGIRRQRFGWPHYEPAQRRAYAMVVFGLAPLLLWTGLAMSPAITSVVPALVTVLGGHQSARTLHFAAASLLTMFVILHLVMVAVSGFTVRMRRMARGGAA